MLVDVELFLNCIWENWCIGFNLWRIGFDYGWVVEVFYVFVVSVFVVV